MARQGDRAAFGFPRAVMDDRYEFSFSGLKTAVLRETQRLRKNNSEMPTRDLAASFQTAVVDALVTKTAKAAKEFQVKAVHLTGGVSANSQLREEMRARLSPLPVRFPPLSLCTDNAAMIGAAAYYRILGGAQSDLTLDVSPNLPL
ncbi:MAG: carbamoyltransferase N-terminal domain-containing protein [Chloroflexota bacterium]